jgi:hypothetical protein
MAAEYFFKDLYKNKYELLYKNKEPSSSDESLKEMDTSDCIMNCY